VQVTTLLAHRPGEIVPPLQDGDNLTREEFERLWDLHPEIKHAERINGIVHLELSVSPGHAVSHSLVVLWLGTYWGGRRSLEVGDNATVRLGDDDLQPDAYLRKVSGGRSRRTTAAIEGPPELVFEVAASCASIDLHQKFNAYQRHGVAEYVVWRVYDEALDWFVLRDGAFERVEADASGHIESLGFPGLRLHVPSLLAGDVPGLLGALGAGDEAGPR
jgi:hypothetical protein